MDTQTILLIVLAAIVSIAVVLFQYFYRQKKSDSLTYLLSFLRFAGIFCVLLLLINPKIEKNTYSLEKGKLVVLSDNSSSMGEYGEAERLLANIDEIKSNSILNERFEIESYAFSRDLSGADSLSFDQSSTNISNALLKVKELYANSKTAAILFTDGNQTEGVDYEFVDLNDNLKVFPVVIGDTTKYRDLSVGQVSLNKYAFLKNQFPIEVTVLYQGKEPSSADLTLYLDGIQVHQQRLEFSKYEKSKTITQLLRSNSVGIKSVAVKIEALQGERNTVNNRKETAIEIIDEQTNIALISNVLHPDMGALKKSIESNEQRTVIILKPTMATALLEDVDIVILYQPTSNFAPIYNFIDTRKIPTISVIGTKTDLQFINQSQDSLLSIETGYPEQEVFGKINIGFPHFDISDINLNEYPPLLSNSGPVNFKIKNDALVGMNIKGVEMETPLMALVTDTGYKQLFLFGENIWKWRAQNFRDGGNFDMFDGFIGKLMVFLSKSGKRNRLEVEYEKVYEGASLAKIRASFFDETFVLDRNANLLLQLSSEGKNLNREIPMLFKGSYFEADLSNLPSGQYNFTVNEKNENISNSGSFKILEFNPEQQFLSANHEKLLKLANASNGKLYFMDQLDSLASHLSSNELYVPIQKSKRKVVSLIDFRFILGIMVLAFALEWFIRKFNGLL